MIIGTTRNKVRDEWIRYDVTVLAQRQVQHPELRSEAREAFVAGAAGMYRIFTDEISTMSSAEAQRRAVQELREMLRTFAVEAGRR